jgi:cytochrome P450
MIGIPRSEYRLFGRWLKALWMLTTSTGNQNLVEMLASLTIDMDRVFHELIAERRRAPCDDLVTTLVSPQPDGRVFTDSEVAGLLALLVVTAEGGATQTLANTMICLDQFPEVRERLWDDPSLLGNAIEEIMRYRSQTARVSRRAVRDVEFGGHEIPAGSSVSVWLTSANRDERVFDRPDVFDIDRKDNQHLSFGKGIHFCLGAPLARLQVRVGLEHILREWVDFSIDYVNSQLLDPRIIPGARELALKVTWRDSR